MEFINLSKSRYTTKKYNSSKKISDNEIEELREILRLSPSSINSQPWKFFFVSNEEIKKQLAEVSYFNEQKIKDKKSKRRNWLVKKFSVRIHYL